MLLSLFSRYFSRKLYIKQKSGVLTPKHSTQKSDYKMKLNVFDTFSLFN